MNNHELLKHQLLIDAQLKGKKPPKFATKSKDEVKPAAKKEPVKQAEKPAAKKAAPQPKPDAAAWGAKLPGMVSSDTE